MKTTFGGLRVSDGRGSLRLARLLCGLLLLVLLFPRLHDLDDLIIESLHDFNHYRRAAARQASHALRRGCGTRHLGCVTRPGGEIPFGRP
jgi:hypothetical protein